MGVSLIRFQTVKGPEWGALKRDEVIQLGGDFSSLAEFLASNWRAKLHSSLPNLRLEDLKLLSPVTAPCQIICQGKNYLDHVVETGTKPKDKDFNIFFTKADSTLAPPSGKIQKPERVKLLDYEVELGLVIGKEINAGSKITEENLHEFIAGFVMGNDLSARDVQIPERQWFKGKSFRGFCPVGPVLFLPERAEFASLLNLDLELKVNGKVRQKSNTKMLIYPPLPTLNEIAQIFDMRPGDLLLTGTPGGVAMRVKPKNWWQELLASQKSDKQKFAEFIEEQAASGRYLQAGDQIESSIRAADGSVDLGQQRLVVS
ncbi:MAG: fumarylacetoacetate hydrolase family protein [Bdellovibrionota bacterium]